MLVKAATGEKTVDGQVIWGAVTPVSLQWYLGEALYTWWRHQVETFSASLALCAGNSPVTGEFLAQRPVTRNFDVFFDLRRINCLVSNREVGDLRRHRAHYDVSIMKSRMNNKDCNWYICRDWGETEFELDILCVTHVSNAIYILLKRHWLRRSPGTCFTLFILNIAHFDSIKNFIQEFDATVLEFHFFLLKN